MGSTPAACSWDCDLSAQQHAGCVCVINAHVRASYNGIATAFQAVRCRFDSCRPLLQRENSINPSSARRKKALQPSWYIGCTLRFERREAGSTPVEGSFRHLGRRVPEGAESPDDCATRHRVASPYDATLRDGLTVSHLSLKQDNGGSTPSPSALRHAVHIGVVPGKAVHGICTRCLPCWTNLIG